MSIFNVTAGIPHLLFDHQIVREVVLAVPALGIVTMLMAH
jgi:hypothetical protein